VESHQGSLLQSRRASRQLNQAVSRHAIRLWFLVVDLAQSLAAIRAAIRVVILLGNPATSRLVGPVVIHQAIRVFCLRFSQVVSLVPYRVYRLHQGQPGVHLGVPHEVL
jgi:hypothetical protein